MASQKVRARYDNNTPISMSIIMKHFERPDVSKSYAGQLRNLVHNAFALYSLLQSLGSFANTANSMLIYIVMEKVDIDTRKEWKDSFRYNMLSTWDQCSKVLEKKC